MTDVYVGVDIGGTNTVVGLLDAHLNIIKKSSFPTPGPGGQSEQTNPSAYLDRIAEEIRKLVREAGTDGHLRAVGIGVPGRVDSESGIVRNASNLGWREVHLASELQCRLNLPVGIEHDVRSYALGEVMSGAGTGFKNIICVTIGTGVAAGIIVDGNLVRGADYTAGEIGHDAVDGETTVCLCGKTGCLETIVSAPGIVRMAEGLIRSGLLSSLAHLSGKVTAHDVYRACLDGDQDAQKIFHRVGTMLGRRLVTLVYTLNPEVIIIGGGVAEAGDFLLDPIREELWKHAPSQQSFLKINLAQLKDNAGLIGAVSGVQRMSSSAV